MNLIKILLDNKFFFRRIILGFTLIQILGVTTFCYSQERFDILDLRYSIFKIDYRLNGESTTHQKFVTVLAEDNSANRKWKTGRTLKATGNIITVPSLVFMGLGIANMNSDNEITSGVAQTMLIGGLGGTIIGLTLIIIGKKETLNAIEMFNSKNKVHIELQGNQSYLGLIINLNNKRE